MTWSAAALELATLALAGLVLAWDLVAPARRDDPRRGALHAAAVAGLALVLLGSALLDVPARLGAAYVQDAFALYVKRVLLATAIVTIAALAPYARRRGFADRAAEGIVLILFATVGGMALVSAREYLTLFVAFELLSLPLYVLVAIDKERPTAAEGSMKLFLFGSVSSAILLLGIGLRLAATGTTAYWPASIPHPEGALLGLVGALILAGFGFKIAAFPFSLWVPDTYQAAPTPIVAFLSVAPKAAAVAALVRLVAEDLGPLGIASRTPLVVLAALSMIVGNLLALRQSDLKRLLAFSGIAQIGYVLTALAAGTRLAAGFALFYFVAYLVSNAGAFLVVAALETAGEEPTLHGVRGLFRRAPALAAAMLVFLLSLGGIPFALGFWGKTAVFLAAAQAGLYGLVLLGALLAVVALYYYLTVARWLFIAEDDGPSVAVPASLWAVILACALVAGAGGLYPRPLVDSALRAADSITISSPR